MTFDQSSDLNGQRLYRVVNLFTTPDWVKAASSVDICGDSALPIRVYADPTHREFPFHTKAATWVSYAFLLDSQIPADQINDINSKLKQAAAFHGITDSLEQLSKEFIKQAADPESSLNDDDFALVYKLPTGEKQRRYPLRNYEEYIKAGSYLMQHRDAIPYTYRKQMAEKILEKLAMTGCSRQGAMLVDFLEKQAGIGWCSAKDAAHLLDIRSRLLKRTNLSLSEVLADAAQDCIKNAEKVRQPGNLQKLAELVDRIDRDHHLDREYGHGLDRPDDVLFGITYKVAEDYLDDHCTMTSGKVYSINDLCQVKLSDVRNLFGNDFADSVSVGGVMISPEKMAEVGATLPRPDAELLDELLAQSGVRPIAKEAAHYGSWLTDDVMKQLAME